MKRLVLAAFLITTILLGVGASASAQSAPPRNVILLIGDGMGTGQLTAMKTALGEIALDAFPVGGFSATSSLNDLVTESAAGGTALSTGQRTNNYRLAVGPDGMPLRTLLEAARAQGKATGVIATSSITHATPASFLSHVENRELEFDIAEQIAVSNADVIIGGGRKFFLPNGSGGERTDGRNLAAEMSRAGYSYVHSPASALPKQGRLLWLLADEALPAASRRTYSEKELVESAIGLLSKNANGFVLMVEGSQIDWAAHDNDFPALLAELRDFNGAIAAALAFAKQDEATLVVVTADHETGGLAVIGEQPDGSDMQGRWIWGEHTANMVPVLAYGPSSAMFGGMHRNCDIGAMLQKLLQ